MAKKVVSIPIRKKKHPIKHRPQITKKLKLAFKKILNFMKSDNYYMFSPLINPQSSISPASPSRFGEVSMKKKEKKLVEELEDYLKCDCYMYAPLLKDSCPISPEGMHSPEKDSARVCDSVEQRAEETTGLAGRTFDSLREVEHEAICVPVSRIAVKHIRIEKETVKHVVHQNCRSSSIPGKTGKQKESSGVVVE